MNDRRDDTLKNSMAALNRALTSITSTTAMTADKPTSSQPREPAAPQSPNIRINQQADPKLIDVLKKVAESLKPMTLNRPPNVLDKTSAFPFPNQLPQPVTLPKTLPQPPQQQQTPTPKTPSMPTGPMPVAPTQRTKDVNQTGALPSVQEFMASLIKAVRAGIEKQEAVKPAPSWRERLFGTEAKPGVTEKEKTEKVNEAKTRVAKAEETVKNLPKKVERQEIKVAQAQDAYDRLPDNSKRKERAKVRLEKAQEGLTEVKEKMQAAPEALKSAKAALGQAEGMEVGKEAMPGMVGNLVGDLKKEGAGGMAGAMKMKDGLGKIAGGAGKDSAGASLGGMAEAAGGAAGMVAGAVGGPAGSAFVGGLTKMATVTFEAVDKLRGWADTLHESNMRFKEFSAAMANVAANQEVREMMLSQERGDRRAGSAGKLADAKQDLTETLAPLFDSIDNLTGDIMTEVITILNKVLKPVVEIATTVVKWFTWSTEEKVEEMDVRMPEWIESSIADDFTENIEGFNKW
jgi:hypothetical protein